MIFLNRIKWEENPKNFISNILIIKNRIKNIKLYRTKIK